MSHTFRLTLAQLNPTVGDLAGNADKARDAWAQAKAAGADMVILPEMFITGYQTQDLIMKPAFAEAALEALTGLARDCADGPVIGVGGPVRQDGLLYNGYFILEGGEIVHQVLKRERPNDGVFDEVRLYAQGPVQGPYTVNGLRIGTPICEDAWHPEVSEALAETGAEVLIVTNGSPYHRDKYDIRLNHMVAR
ncbi:MAG: nitrilase-related carbon-nitrogen hydrolase, partial [Pseudomonadota bacterium]